MPITKANFSQPQVNAPKTRMDFNVPEFGGLDTTTDPTLMNDIDSPDALNNIYDSVQSTASRKGYTKLLTTKTASFIGGMYALYQSNGTKQIVYASGNQLYIYNNAGGSTVITGSPASFTTNQQWDFDEYQDTVYGGNGTDALISYNGSPSGGLAIVNSGIMPQFVKVHKNRVYCVNKNSSTLYFSDAGDPTSFPVNNFIQINTNDGQNITGLSVILDNLIIFKSDSVWILTGDPLGAGNTTTIGNLQLRQANSSVGCSAFRTIQLVDQDLFFMHVSGIYVLQNYSAQLVTPGLNFTFKNQMNPGFVNLCWGIYNNAEKKYLLGYPSSVSTTPDSIIGYDMLVKQPFTWDDHPGSCAVNYRFSGLTDSILMGDPVQGNIYELIQGYFDIAGDNGTASSGSQTTITDSTKTWIVNEFVDCRVALYTIPNDSLGTPEAPVIAYTSTVTSNTSTTLTLSTTLPVSSAGYLYTIGYYDSHWDTKNFDFEMEGYSKKYKYFNVFLDSQQWPIFYGYSVDFAPLSYTKQLPQNGSAPLWGDFVWGDFTWGTNTSEFVQSNIGSTGRHIQHRFGSFIGGQPWRVVRYSTTYKLKKMRPNIVAS